MPDAELSARAAAGDLRNESVLLGQVRRMLKDERARRMATEFGGNWLDFRRFDEHNAVDRERFPEFNNELRAAMFEEPIRFIADVMRNDRSVLDMLYGSHTFANPILAKHYGIPGVVGSAETMAPHRQRARLSARRSSSDGGVPDAERARPADEPRQARVLGRAARARRSHSPTAADGARAAERRGQAGPAAAGDAGEASRQSVMLVVPRALRFVRADLRRLRPGRRNADERPGGTRRSTRRRPFQAGARGRDWPVYRATSGPTAKKTFWTTLAVKCWCTLWAAPCCCRMNRSSSG